MKEIKKFYVIIIPLVIICIFSGVILFNVIIGNLGNRENWRLICAIMAFIIINGMTLLFILKLKRL